jgi:hypothetical protein
MTYLEEINKLRALLQVVAYPRYGTEEWFLTRTDCAERIQAVCELEDIEPLEADTYYAHGRYSTEAEAKEGLATCAYAGKWKSAKEGVASEKPELSGPAYWDAVRLYFLELGGTWQSEVTTPASIDWSAPLPRPIIPALPYAGEPMKVRQG